MDPKTLLTPRRIFLFWLPLAAMWLIMAAEQPSITAAVTRLPDAKQNLAAFGLTFAFALIIESPVIMMLTAGTALSTHRQAYERLLRFVHIMSVVLTVLHLLLALTPLYGFILREWVGAPEEIIETSRVAFLLMLPWTAMIAYRRLWEGVMIRYGQPQRVTRVIVVRLAATVLVLAAGLWLGRWPGAYVGGVALSVGVTVGALSAWLLARPTLQEGLTAVGPEDEPLGWARLGRFYFPLALTTLITMVSQPIVAFGLSRAPRPLESLAVWPVVMSLIFIGRSSGMAFQEVSVALLRDMESFATLRRFAWVLAGLVTGVVGLLVLPPVLTWWYRNVSGLEPELVRLALLPTALMALVPGLNVLLSWYRGVLIWRKRTGPISMSVALNMGSLLVLLLGLPRVWDAPGAVLAATAFTLSMLLECAFLRWQSAASLPQPYRDGVTQRHKEAKAQRVKAGT